MKPFFVYLLRCGDGTFYAGHTDELEARLHQHETADSGYTATRHPVEMVWHGEFETREGALAFEQQVKGWSRAKKEALIAGDWERIQQLAKSHGEGTQGLRQAQPERAGGVGTGTSTASSPAPTTTVRPEPVEGLAQTSGLRQAQPERAGGVGTGTGTASSPAPTTPTAVRPEPVEVLAQASWLRQAQPERAGGAGAESAPASSSAATPATVRPELVEGLTQNIVAGTPMVQRRAMAKAITLLESTRADHREQADLLLTALLPHTGRAFRLGISGVPGVGKSTFIEALGLYLIGRGHRVAVLTIDPSSTVSGGSILGDKTRMEHLSVHEQAYIRPSPSSGTLGGVAEKTREAMLVCEAAGYDIVIVETVGVGQSETAVANMSDMFVLLQLPNAGDDLQAIKKGVMELADLVVINKADIDPDAATRARAQITSSLRLLGLQGRSEHAHHNESIWHPQVIQLSALHNQGVDRFWAEVSRYQTLQGANGRLAERRQQQARAWMWERIDAGLKQAFRRNPQVHARLPALEQDVLAGRVPASAAARQLLNLHESFFPVRAEPVEAPAILPSSPSTGSGRSDI